jgi:hypothetical protein
MPPANRQAGRPAGVATARRLQIALRLQFAPVRVTPVLQAIVAQGLFSFARAMGYQAALPLRRLPRPKAPFDEFPTPWRVDSRSDRHMGATADGPREGKPRGCQSRPSRESWLRPSRTSTSSMSRNARSSSIGVIGSLLRVAQRNALRGRLAPRRCSPSGVAERVDPVDRPLVASIMKYSFTCSMVNKVLLL